MDTICIKLANRAKFFAGDEENAWYKGYDDLEWNTVSLPHDWSIKEEFSEEYSSGTGYVKGGIGWYRIPFVLPKNVKGKRIKIRFEGVYKKSKVWLNSYYLGKMPNGYLPFSYDVTNQLNYEEDNMLSVRVDRSQISDSRWFTGSGITRNIYMVIEEEVHPVEYGVTFSARKFSGDEVVFEVKEEIRNDADEEKNVTVKVELEDKNRKCVISLLQQISLPKLSEKTIIFQEKLVHPFLWSDRDPNQYQLKTYYNIGEGEYLVDSQKVGFRKIEFDTEKGFFCNDQNIKLKGVCVHHDGGAVGAVVTKDMWRRRLEELKNMGCNAIRCSHNPHNIELYDLCDEMGFFVMDEAFDEWENAKNKWSRGHNIYPPKHQGYYEDFPQFHERDLRTMVRRDRNHPSIIMWSIGNEIDYPNDPYCHPLFQNMTGNNDANKPEAEKQFDHNKPNMERLSFLAKKLVHIVKEEDCSRPVTLAAAFPELSTYIGFVDALDVVGYNYKENFYESHHKRMPNLPILGSENGHGFDAWLHVRDKEYISGQFLWTGIDYLGEAKGWPIHGSAAGLLTTAGFRKPEYMRRKSFWVEEEILYLTTRKISEGEERYLPMKRSWNYILGEEILVQCYTNLDIVELKVNNKTVKIQEKYNGDGCMEFILPFEEGILSCEGKHEKDGKIIKDQIATTKEPFDIIVETWNSKKGKDYEEDVLIIEIGVEDRLGRKILWCDNLVSIEIGCDCEFLGLDNGNLEDITPYFAKSRRMYQGKLVCYLRKIGDEASIKIKVEGINTEKEIRLT